MSSELRYENNDDFDYGADSRSSVSHSRSRSQTSARTTPQRGRKRGKSPVSVNGIHRRRRRKLAW